MTPHATDGSQGFSRPVALPRWWKALPLALCLGFSQPLLAAPSSLDTQIAQIQQAIAANESQMSALERSLRSYDAKLQETQRQIRSERDNNYRSLHTARREITRQKFELERIQQSINLLDQQIDLVKTDTDRSIARYESLNTLKRSLETSDHTRKLQENARRIASLERDKQPLQEKLAAARSKFDALQAQLPETSAADANVDDHPAMIELLNQRAAEMNQLNKLRQQMRIHRATLAQAQEQKRAALARAKTEAKPKAAPAATVATTLTKPLEFDPPPAAGIPPGNKAYVFAISGDVAPSIENVLNLKSWVESYGAKYFEARWNGFSPSNRQDTEQFRREFADRLRQIPPAARIILIGHGRGGGAAIEAATDVAYVMGRSIDFLAVLDPVGDKALRANIVYKSAGCNSPASDDKQSTLGYIDCIDNAAKRAITSNVKHFYNRWQKEGFGPADYARSYPVLDDSGEFREASSATGRFALADNIQADQKRLFFNNDKDAHMTLLQQESRNLPNLLVKHLR